MNSRSKLRKYPVKISIDGRKFHPMRNVIIYAYGWFDACKGFKDWIMSWLGELNSDQATYIYNKLKQDNNYIDTFNYDNTTYTTRR